MGLVGRIYSAAFAAEMAVAAALDYVDLGWDDAQVLALCEALRAAHVGGGLTKLTRLYLSYNRMGDVAVAALVALIEEGAMPKLKELYLHHNQISVVGVAALASALRGGALLPSCEEIDLGGNQISDAGFAALASALLSPPGRRAAVVHGGRLFVVSASVAIQGGSDAPVHKALASPERAAALALRQAE